MTINVVGHREVGRCRSFEECGRGWSLSRSARRAAKMAMAGATASPAMGPSESEWNLWAGAAAARVHTGAVTAAAQHERTGHGLRILLRGARARPAGRQTR